MSKPKPPSGRMRVNLTLNDIDPNLDRVGTRTGFTVRLAHTEQISTRTNIVSVHLGLRPLLFRFAISSFRNVLFICPAHWHAHEAPDKQTHIHPYRPILTKKEKKTHFWKPSRFLEIRARVVTPTRGLGIATVGHKLLSHSQSGNACVLSS